MMRQAQKLQKEMMDEKTKIDEMIFVGESSFVKVEMFGNNKVKQVLIDKDKLDKEDIEMLEDMLAVAINQCHQKIEEETSNKLGKYTNGMPGLF